MWYIESKLDGSVGVYSPSASDGEVKVYDAKTETVRTVSVDHIDNASEGLRLEAARDRILDSVLSYQESLNTAYFAQKPYSVGFYLDEKEFPRVNGQVYIYPLFEQGYMFIEACWTPQARPKELAVRRVCKGYHHIRQIVFDSISDVMVNTRS